MDWLERVEEKLETFKSEYDLSELAANDILQLRSLAEAMSSLDVYNEMLEQELAEDPRSIKNIADIQKLITEAGKNISTISGDLKIDRKNRERKTESVPDYVRDLKSRARKFLEQRMVYIYCPKCKTLLMSAWLLDLNAGNKFKFNCSNCKHSFVVDDVEFATQHKNIPDVIVPLGPS